MKVINFILMSVILVLTGCQGQTEGIAKGLLVRTNPEYVGHLFVNDLETVLKPSSLVLTYVYEDYFFIEYFKELDLYVTDLPYNEKTVRLDSVGSEHIIDKDPFKEEYWCDTRDIDYIRDYIINNELHIGMRIK